MLASNSVLLLEDAQRSCSLLNGREKDGICVCEGVKLVRRRRSQVTSEGIPCSPALSSGQVVYLCLFSCVSL